MVGKAAPLIVVPSVITCDVCTVDVELIKSGCMLLVDILTPLFGLVIFVFGGGVVLRGNRFRAVACRMSPPIVDPPEVNVVVDIIVEPLSES